MTCNTPIHWLQNCCPPAGVSLAGMLCPDTKQKDGKPDGAGGRKHVIVYPRTRADADEMVKSLYEDSELETETHKLNIKLAQRPSAPINPQAPPVFNTDDAELIALLRKDEITRHRLLLEAIREDEERLMEEVAVLVALDA